ncbi:MAG: cellulase family glycosylhydrolase, partial [Candidatus Eisenbacteria bacterium]|nr:cellulase family glycosylhydrolase [Candidatus Eisenbacteria bacterium]
AGLYSVYDADAGTAAAIAAHAAQLFAYLGPSAHDDFYTHPTCRRFYRDHVEAVLTRINTLTGTAYRDDPTILCWELGNEPRAQSDNTGAKMQAWIEEMAPFFKAVDANHLLTTGQEGFYDYDSGPWWLNGSQGTNFITNHQVPEVDLCTFHLWPSHWSWNYSQSMSWVSSHIADAHGTIGKPIFIGEFGYPRDGGGGTSGRDQLYQGVFDAFATQSASGSLFWILYHDAYPDYDGFGVYYPADAATIAIIEAAAEAAAGTDPPENVSGFWAETRSGEEGLIDLAWSEPEGITAVRIYRRGVGGYPLYDDGGGVVPEWPESEGEAQAQGWTPVVDQAPGTPLGVDQPGARDMCYYAAFTEGCNGLVAGGAPGARGRSLNYRLGDFDADGSVYFQDLVIFSNAFDTCAGQPGFLAEIDIGPTDDATELGLPLTDGCVGFEDLMILSLAWDGGGRRPAQRQFRADEAGEEGPVVFWLEPVDRPESGGAAGGAKGWRVCCATGGHALKGVRMVFTWSGASDAPRTDSPAVRAGEAWGSPAWFHVSEPSAPGLVVTAACLRAGGLQGERLVLAAIDLAGAADAPDVRLARVAARDPANRELSVQVVFTPPAQRPGALKFSPGPSPAAGAVSLWIESPAAVAGTVYDVQGRAVAALGPWLAEGGRARCEWDRRGPAGGRLGPGVYLLELRSGSERQRGRIVLID